MLEPAVWSNTELTGGKTDYLTSLFPLLSKIREEAYTVILRFIWMAAGTFTVLKLNTEAGKL